MAKSKKKELDDLLTVPDQDLPDQVKDSELDESGELDSDWAKELDLDQEKDTGPVWTEDPAAEKPDKSSSFESEQKKRGGVRPIFVIAGALAVLLVLALLGLTLTGALGGSQPTATARTLSDVNLRQGPSVGNPSVGAVPQGSKVKVVGRNEDGSWLLVETKDGGQAWMTGLAEYVDIDPAALERLPVVASSGIAVDSGNPAVARVLTDIPLVVYHADHFTCASHSGLNNLLPEVAEGNVIGPHSGDFAYAAKEGNVLFKYTNGSFVLIRDNPIARFDGDLEMLPLDKALQMFEDGEIVWTGGIGNWPGRGVPGCDYAAQAN